MHGSWPLASLPGDVLDTILHRALSLEDDPVAVLVTGSYAAGQAVLESDLDLTVLLGKQPVIGYRTWFTERPGRPLHVSCGFETLDDWLDRFREPASWSLGFPTATPVTYLWATDAARAMLGEDPTLRRPAGEPELEDFVEAASKASRAVRDEDWMRARWHARSMAELAPRLLIPLNPERRAVNTFDAVEAALSFPLAPEHYREDLVACLALESTDNAHLAEAAVRLPREMLAFLRERRPDIDGQPWLSRYLENGTLERHLELGTAESEGGSAAPLDASEERRVLPHQDARP